MGKGAYKLTDPNQTPNANAHSPAVRPWGMSFMVERETAQTAS
jgi:hypothetical protein